MKVRAMRPALLTIKGTLTALTLTLALGVVAVTWAEAGGDTPLSKASLADLPKYCAAFNEAKEGGATDEAAMTKVNDAGGDFDAKDNAQLAALCSTAGVPLKALKGLGGAETAGTAEWETPKGGVQGAEKANLQTRPAGAVTSEQIAKNAQDAFNTRLRGGEFTEQQKGFFDGLNEDQKREYHNMYASRAGADKTGLNELARSAVDTRVQGREFTPEQNAAFGRLDTTGKANYTAEYERRVGAYAAQAARGGSENTSDLRAEANRIGNTQQVQVGRSGLGSVANGSGSNLIALREQDAASRPTPPNPGTQAAPGSIPAPAPAAATQPASAATTAAAAAAMTPERAAQWGRETAQSGYTAGDLRDQRFQRDIANNPTLKAEYDRAYNAQLAGGQQPYTAPNEEENRGRTVTAPQPPARPGTSELMTGAASQQNLNAAFAQGQRIANSNDENDLAEAWNKTRNIQEREALAAGVLGVNGANNLSPEIRQAIRENRLTDTGIANLYNTASVGDPGDAAQNIRTALAAEGSLAAATQIDTTKAPRPAAAPAPGPAPAPAATTRTPPADGSAPPVPTPGATRLTQDGQEQRFDGRQWQNTGQNRNQGGGQNPLGQLGQGFGQGQGNQQGFGNQFGNQFGQQFGQQQCPSGAQQVILNGQLACQCPQGSAPAITSNNNSFGFNGGNQQSCVPVVNNVGNCQVGQVASVQANGSTVCVTQTATNEASVREQAGYLDGVRVKDGTCGLGIDSRFSTDNNYLAGYNRGQAECRAGSGTGTTVSKTTAPKDVSDARVRSLCTEQLGNVSKELKDTKGLFTLLFRDTGTLSDAERTALGFDETIEKRLLQAKNQFDAGKADAVSIRNLDSTRQENVPYREGYACGRKLL